MKPDAQTEALARCLALQPLVGWPEWMVGDATKYSLRESQGSWWRHTGEHKQTWAYTSSSIAAHEALCIWQDHLLRWLANRSRYAIEYCPVLHWMIDCAGGAHADTLIEAVLDVCEQIQKGTDDA